VDLWLLVFPFVFGFDPVLFAVFFMCFVVSIGFRYVLVVRKGKGEWTVCFGEDQVSFGWFSWNFLFFVVFTSDAVLDWGVFDVFWGLRLVLVGFMLVVMVKKCKLWVLENIG